MKEVLKLSQTDIEAMLARHVCATRKWRQAKVTLQIQGPSQDGPMHSPGFVSAEIERIEEDVDPY